MLFGICRPCVLLLVGVDNFSPDLCSSLIFWIKVSLFLQYSTSHWLPDSWQMPIPCLFLLSYLGGGGGCWSFMNSLIGLANKFAGFTVDNSAFISFWLVSNIFRAQNSCTQQISNCLLICFVAGPSGHMSLFLSTAPLPHTSSCSDFQNTLEWYLTINSKTFWQWLLQLLLKGSCTLSIVLHSKQKTFWNWSASILKWKDEVNDVSQLSISLNHWKSDWDSSFQWTQLTRYSPIFHLSGEYLISTSS
jgi:hypothetical protein